MLNLTTNLGPSRRIRERAFCGDRNRGCGASLTSTDLELGHCTQCGEPLEVPEFPLEQALLLSLSEIQSQREAVRGSLLIG